jgi:hypothetical protein
MHSRLCISRLPDVEPAFQSVVSDNSEVRGTTIRLGTKPMLLKLQDKVYG